jgi:hypothetical protein
VFINFENFTENEGRFVPDNKNTMKKCVELGKNLNEKSSQERGEPDRRELLVRRGCNDYIVQSRA